MIGSAWLFRELAAEAPSDITLAEQQSKDESGAD